MFNENLTEKGANAVNTANYFINWLVRKLDSTKTSYDKWSENNSI